LAELARATRSTAAELRDRLYKLREQLFGVALPTET